MRKLYALFVFAALSSGFGMTAQDWQLEPVGRTSTVLPTGGNLFNTKTVSTFSALDKSGEINVLSATADDNEDYTPIEGEWIYKSQYTGKSYPTIVSVRTDSETPDYTLIKLENSFFGTFKIASHNVTGDVVNHIDIDEDGYAIYPHVLNEDGTPTDLQIIVQLVADNFGPELGSWNSYPLSGDGRMLIRYGQINEGKGTYCYDYLVNLNAKDCKIKAEFAGGYYNGEKEMSVKLKSGEGVTDVYYVITNDIIDEKRSSADPEWNESYAYYTVGPQYVKEYIDEFNGGEKNEAYTVGKVDPNAEQFNVPLPTTNGVNELYIVALSGDEITDMVRDVIEVRLPDTWTDCGEISLESDIKFNWAENRLILPKYYKLQENADGSLLRVVHPFDTELNTQNNYIYINRSLGMDRCYIERSFSPFESQYSIPDIEGNINVESHPFMMCDIISMNQQRGVKISQFQDYTFTDLSDGMAAESLTLHEFDTYLLSRYHVMNYINNSPYEVVRYTIDNAIRPEKYTRGVTLNAGKAVDHIDWTYGYNQGGQIVSADGFTSTVKIEDEKGTIDLNKLVMNGTIEHDPHRIDYRAFDKNGNVIREGSIDTSKNNFRFVSAIGRIEYEPCYSSLRYFVSDDVEITRRDGVRDDNEALPDGTISYSVEDIQKTWTLIDWSSHLNHTFQIRDGQVVDGGGFQNDLGIYLINSGGESFYGRIYLTGYVDDRSWTRLENGATVKGEFRYPGYRQDSGEYIGDFDRADFTIYIPEELCYEYSGVEDVAADKTEAVAEYYDLQGVKVVHPAAGSLVIEKKGSRVRKLIFRD